VWRKKADENTHWSCSGLVTGGLQQDLEGARKEDRIEKRQKCKRNARSQPANADIAPIPPILVDRALVNYTGYRQQRSAALERRWLGTERQHGGQEGRARRGGERSTNESIERSRILTKPSARQA
jgi:hypothetical protein